MNDMKYRGRRTPQRFMRGHGDYDKTTTEEKAKEERQGCFNVIVFWVFILAIGIWWGSKL